ncbi:MAG: hypothetical protein ACFFDN_35180 [Candidatus Hodarchaeota archaeon]
MKKSKFNSIILFIFLTLVVLLSSYKVLFTTGYHLGVDYSFVDAVKLLPLYLSSWDSYYFLGQPTYGFPMTFGLISTFGLFYVAFYAIFNIFFGPIASIAFLLINYVCPFFGFWYLARYIFKNEKHG